MPAMTAEVEQRMKRWQEQRWILDTVIQTVGIEWDQRRIAYTLGPCGPEATGDFNGVRNRIKKFNDASREFRRAAIKREGIARRMEEQGSTVSARESYFIASTLYGSAQWPIFEHTPENDYLGNKKIECYTKYASYADHEIRRVDIPFENNAIPAWLHLPNTREPGRLPCVVSIPGMDSFKELNVSLYGDKMLERGIAVLAIDGPGHAFSSPAPTVARASSTGCSACACCCARWGSVLPATAWCSSSSVSGAPRWGRTSPIRCRLSVAS